MSLQGRNDRSNLNNNNKEIATLTLAMTILNPTFLDSLKVGSKIELRICTRKGALQKLIDFKLFGQLHLGLSLI